MNFAQQQRDPRRHMVGITTAVFLHAIAIYALTNGLARKVVDVLKKPLDVSIIEEVKKQPPPPKVALPPPKVVEPPPAFVPPPEVQVQPPPVQPVIAVTAPVPPPPPPPAPVVAAPRIVNVGAVCPGYQAVLAKGLAPAQARGLSGKVLVEFIVSASGTVGGVTIVKSSNPALNAIASAAVGQLNCVGQGQSARVQVPLVFEQER